jgi:hypothetical protein
MIRSGAMRYAVWNNKGGVGKSFLSFVLGTEVAHRHPDKNVILVDMCPQANLSEIVLDPHTSGCVPALSGSCGDGPASCRQDNVFAQAISARALGAPRRS